MQLKAFSARSAATVLAQIREELGPDAVILDTREEDGMIVMTAALERKRDEAPQGSDAGFPDAGHTAPGQAGMGLGISGNLNGAMSWQSEWSVIKQCLLTLMKPALDLDKLSSRQRLALEFIQREGVSDDAVLALYRTLQGDPATSILDALGAMVPVRPWNETAWPQRIHVVAGPFGAGKTSAAVRMALFLRTQETAPRICMINADAGRGNGRLLLRHYSELSELGYKEAPTALELAAAVSAAEREGFDRIIVDTPGMPRRKALGDLLTDAGLVQKNTAVHLVLPPHYEDSQLKAMLPRYASPCEGSIIWTKLDEAEHYGHIVNIGQMTTLPVSCLSYGAGLGNSLVPARETLLWKLLFKKELPGDDGRN